MNLLKLQIVELLEKHKKITPVADALGLKQPTVTFHMKSLEQELGVQLFEARSGKILLTEAGQSLCHYSAKINSLAQEAERVVKEYDQLGRGSLRIGASYVPGTYMLPRILSGFAKAYPRISLTLMVKTAPAIKEMLLNHEIDLGILSCEPFQAPYLAAQTLCEDELVLIASPQHPLAENMELDAEQLGKVPFLLHSPESSTRQLTVKWAEHNGIELNAHMELDSLEAIKQTVMLGESVSFVSRLAIRKEVERGELISRPIPQNDYKRYIYYAYNVDRRQSAVLDQFKEHLFRSAAI
ncbi:LysR family transcriptional regulator [Paenibacillus sp. OAS669]|uniref:LysR family transcriptional regulator n=1 Tax=Paenibacillus sp. OAS669 TaxID=2663821 RepID=UPI00178AD356|nr:LysR family transcriptional regulator [Paenibacillus sp. OAS669]MBE1444098.1 DNA-binding transcriptional LysR family regulator [Paenibacillus sp. OAS669]